MQVIDLRPANIITLTTECTINTRPTLTRWVTLRCVALIVVHGGVLHMQQANSDDKLQSPARTDSPVLTILPSKSSVSLDLKVWIAAFPRDTETIVQAHSFELGTIPDDLDKYEWRTVIEQLTLSPMIGSPASKEMLRLLSGRHVRWALYGGRHFKSINSFGSLSGEGACIFVLDKPLGALRGEIRNALDEERAAVRAASNREILAIPPLDGRKENPKGTFVVFWDDRTIIVATSEPFLRHLLKGLTSQSETTVIGRPATSYWAAIPQDADAWLVRSCSRRPETEDAKDRGLLAGVVWTLTYKKKPRCCIRYWPNDHVTVETLGARLRERFDAGLRLVSPTSPWSWEINGGTVELVNHLAGPQGGAIEKCWLMMFLNAHIGMDQD
jgi:hypothetical protein